MRKLFAALAIVLMTGTTATTIVACRKPVYDIEILLVPSKSPLEIESELFNLSKLFQEEFEEVSKSNMKVGFKVSPDYNIASYVLRSGQAAMGMIPVTTYYQKDIKDKEENDRKMGTLFVSTRTAVKTELRSYGELGDTEPATLEQLNSFQSEMNDGGANQNLDEDIVNQFKIAQESNKKYAQDTSNIYYSDADKKEAAESETDEKEIASAKHYRSVIFANREFVTKRKQTVKQNGESGNYVSRFVGHLKGWTNKTVYDAYETLDDNLNFVGTDVGAQQKAHSVILLDLFCQSMESANTGGAKVGLASSATSGAGMVKPVETLMNNFMNQQGLPSSNPSDVAKAKEFANAVLTGYSKSPGYATDLPRQVRDGLLNIGVAFNDARAESQIKEEALGNTNSGYLSKTWMLTTSSGIMNDGMLYSKTFFKRNNISTEIPVLEIGGKEYNSTGNNLLDALRTSFINLMKDEDGLKVMRDIYSHEGYLPEDINNYLDGSVNYDKSVVDAQTSTLNAAASDVALEINQ
ncbi:Vmc-like lipoprotein signal peptide domain-containing protein [Spiroplasma endosymbiont of Othius punctulatus]|uniref:Vmc-like lipoprotein signal peptide domain-containing protein n=1 Tax=Spiroplasma endosymbiont of Othius punctulatus TaxID=3066289 RepID=UPI0030D13224